MPTRNITIAIALASVSFSTIARANDSANISATELDALKARVAQIEFQQHQAAINATIANTHTQNELLRAEGFTAGWDSGFKIGSADGKYLMQIYGTFQFRNITTSTNGFFLEDHDDDEVGETINGFEVRRAKIGIQGKAIDSRLGYNARMAFLRSGGNELEVVFVTWKSTDEWTLKAGQYKSSWTHEENVVDARQLAVERSMLNNVIGGSQTLYVQGVAAMYETDTLRGEMSFSDGALSSNTPWNGEEPTGYDYGIEGRIEYKFSGEWAGYDDFAALKNKEDVFVIGGGFGLSEGSDNTGGDGFDLRHAVDAQWENTTGLAVYGAYVANFSDDGSDESYDWGALVQTGYLIGDSKWEVFGRYTFIQIDDQPAGVEDEYHEITAGMNYYFFNSHNFKFSFDLNYLPNGAPGGVGGLGYVPDDEEQWSLRTQLQVQF